MSVLRQVEAGAFRLQLVECECQPGCQSRVAMAMLEPRPLWLTLLVAPADRMDDSFDEVARRMTAGLDLYAIAHGIALVGMRREVLVDAAAALLQLQAWAEIPDWMARVPIATVNAVRGRVFGSDSVRVIEALKALDRYVPDLPEGPVPAPSVEVLFERQMRVSYPPERRSMS